MRCSICLHENIDAINAALTVGREGTRPVADRFGLSKSSVDRHKQNCLLRKSDPAPSAPVEEVTPATSRAPTFRASGESGPGRPCLMCQSEHRAEVDRRLIAGEPRRAIVAAVFGADDTDKIYARIRHHASVCIAKQIKQAVAESNVACVRPILDSLNEMREIVDEQLVKVRADMQKLDDLEEEVEQFKRDNPDKLTEYCARSAGFQRHKRDVMRTLNETTRSITPLIDMYGKRTGAWTDRTELVIAKHPKWAEFVKDAAGLIAEIEDEALAVKFTDLLARMEKA